MSDFRFSRRGLLSLATATIMAPVLGALSGALSSARADKPASVELKPADREDVARIEKYLNELKSVKAKFQQFSPNEGLAFGSIYLRRPGRLRVEYDPPSQVLLIADGLALSYFDQELNHLEQVPLSLSPMWFLLKEKVELGGDVTITSFDRAPGQFQIGLVQTDEPEAGRVILEFGDRPLELRQWTLVDEEGGEVRVGLYDAEFGIELANNLFATPQKKNTRTK